MAKQIDKTPYQFPATAFKPGTIALFVDIRTGQPIPGRRFHVDFPHPNGKHLRGHEIRDPYPSLMGGADLRPDGTWTYMAMSYGYSISGRVPRLVPTDEPSEHAPRPVRAVRTTDDQYFR